jgi:hypothetical protein
MTGVNMETRSGWKVDAYAGLTTDSGHVKTDDVDSFVKFDITLRF